MDGTRSPPSKCPESPSLAAAPALFGTAEAVCLPASESELETEDEASDCDGEVGDEVGVVGGDSLCATGFDSGG